MIVRKLPTSSLLVIVLLLTIWPPLLTAQELTSTLHSTLYGVNFAYAGENVTFTCVTSGSSVIAWSSDEYIGSGGVRLEFASIEPVGISSRSVLGGGTVAQLTNSTYEDGRVTLVSQLHILVQLTYQISSITCHNIVMDTTNTISFQIADDASVACDKPAVCPGETVMCTCTTGHSSIIAWSSDQLIGKGGSRLEFASVQPVSTTQNASVSDTFAVLVDSSDVNGVVVLESELTFVASESSTNIILTCLNVIRQASHPIIIPISRNCDALSTTLFVSSVTDLILSTTELDSRAATTSRGSPNTGNDLAVVIGIFIAIFIALGFIILSTCMVIVIKTVYTRRAKVHLKDSDYQLKEIKCYSRTEEQTILNDEEPNCKPEQSNHDNEDLDEGYDFDSDEENLEPLSEEEDSSKIRAHMDIQEESDLVCPVTETIRDPQLSTSTMRSVNGMDCIVSTNGIAKEELHQTTASSGKLLVPVYCSGLDSPGLELKEGMKTLAEEKRVIEDQKKELEEKKEEMECERKELEKKSEEIDCQREEMEHQRKELEEKSKEVEYQRVQMEYHGKVLEEKVQELMDEVRKMTAEIDTLTMNKQMLSINLIEKEQQIEKYQQRENEMILQTEVDILKDELGNRDTKIACIKSDTEDLVKDVVKQEKATYGYYDMKKTDYQKSKQGGAKCDKM